MFVLVLLFLKEEIQKMFANRTNRISRTQAHSLPSVSFTRHKITEINNSLRLPNWNGNTCTGSRLLRRHQSSNPGRTRPPACQRSHCRAVVSRCCMVLQQQTAGQIRSSPARVSLSSSESSGFYRGENRNLSLADVKTDAHSTPRLTPFK